jgi:hypothetical protein
VKEKANEVKNWLSGSFDTFKDWAKDFVSNVYEDIKPELQQIRDMAIEV